MNAAQLQQITDAMKATEKANEVRTNLSLALTGRLKTTVPISSRLNKFINDWFDKNWSTFLFTDEDDFDEDDIEGTLKRHREHYSKTGVIKIWTGCSEGTIFGEPTINHKFRAWHDYIHITQNLGYDFIGESVVSDIQQSQLPTDWYAEKQLIHCEVVGQAQYFMEQEEFLKDQRLFTGMYFVNPLGAIRTKQ